MHICVYTKMIVGTVMCIVLFTSVVNSFEYSGYCQKMCLYGRGGNLCRCNAVHFAGKRGQLETMKSPPDLQDYDLDMDSQSESDEDEVRAALDSSSNSRRKINQIKQLLSSLQDTDLESKDDEITAKRNQRLLAYAIKTLLRKPHKRTAQEVNWNQLLGDDQSLDM